MNTLQQFPTMMRRRTWSIILLLAVICQAGAVDPVPAGPFLLQWQQPWTLDSKGVDTSTPSYFASHLGYIDTLPFDGTIFNHQCSYQIMHSVPVDEAALASQFASLAGVKPVRFVHNFALVNVRKPADFFGDWSVPIANFRAMARVCRNAGLRGIMFDDEEYAGLYDFTDGSKFSVNIWNWPEDVSDKAKTLADYQAQARVRGRQIMVAMAQEYPGIVVIAAHGAAESDPTINWWFGHPFADFELMGPFLAGLVEGAGTNGRFVDGGEWHYAERTVEDFDVAYEYSKNWLPSAWVDCAYLPASLRAVWPARMGIGFGIYNLTYGGRAMNPAIMRSTVAAAMRRSDSYVFQYTEDMVWFESGRVSQEWKDAIAGGKADALAAGRMVDAVCGFSGVPSGTAVALDGVHDGIGFGSGKWVVDSTGPGGFTACARFAGSAATSGTFSLPAGRWLKSIRLCADSAVTVTVSDHSGPTKGNAPRRVSLAADVPYELVTGWTYPGPNVAISVAAAGCRVVMDDVRYLGTLPPAPSPPTNVRAFGP
jgi:hypothetical protein